MEQEITKQEVWAGNINSQAKDNKGWIMGHFMRPQSSPFCSQALEIKWHKITSGNKKDRPRAHATGKTLNILISGKIKIEFPEIRRTVILEREGDYLFFEPNVIHSWEDLEDGLLIAIRWPSLPKDQQ